MNDKALDDYQEKLAQFKKAIQNNEFQMDSTCIAQALLEAQKYAKKQRKTIKEPEMA